MAKKQIEKRMTRKEVEKELLNIRDRLSIVIKSHRNYSEKGLNRIVNAKWELGEAYEEV